jgi:hypothetical protein
MILISIILSTFVGLIAFLGVQTTKDGRQDSLTNNLKSQLQYVSDEVDMLKMGGTNSTLIEVGVCQILPSSISGISPHVALVNYSLFSNSIRNYIVFGNVSTFPMVSSVTSFYPQASCPFYTDYIQLLSFYIAGCTTDLTGTNFTITKFNEISWYNLYGSILKEDQSKIKPDGIFLASGDQCNQNQVSFSYVALDFGFQNVGDTFTNAIRFYILSQNTSTTLSFSGPIMLLLPNSQSFK